MSTTYYVRKPEAAKPVIFFKVVDSKVIPGPNRGGESLSRIASLQLEISGKEKWSEKKEGSDALRALEEALREELSSAFPISRKVEVLGAVMLSDDGEETVKLSFHLAGESTVWESEGRSTNRIEAIIQALADGFNYAISLDQKRNGKK